METVLDGADLAGEGEVFVVPEGDVAVGALFNEAHHIVHILHYINVFVVPQEIALIDLPPPFYGFYKRGIPLNRYLK